MAVPKKRSAYQLFCDDKRASVSEEVKEKKEITKKLRAMWKELDEEEKKVYVEKEEKLIEEANESKLEMEKKAEAKKKREEKKKIPHARSAYIFFCEERRPAAKKENPGRRWREC